MRSKKGHESDEPPQLHLIFHDVFSSTDTQVPVNRVYRHEELAPLFAADLSHFLSRPSEHLLQLLDAVLSNETLDDAKVLRPAIFLSCALVRDHVSHFHFSGKLTIESHADGFPIGAGLGSSAAFSVALASALWSLVHPDVGLDQAKVNEYAFASEVVLHGTPSGVDNTVALYGGLLSYQKAPNPVVKALTTDLSGLQFLIVNTRVPRSTRTQVMKVREQYDKCPDSIQPLFDRINCLATEFMKLSAANAFSMEGLGKSFEENHAILNSLGVGHEAIERVVTITSKYGGWTKLTGAGGGGCTLTLLPPSLTRADIDSLLAQLTEHGMQGYLSSLGGQGVQVLRSAS